MGDTALNDGSRLFLRMSFYKGLWEDAEGTGVGGKIKAEKLSNKRDCLKEAEAPGFGAHCEVQCTAYSTCLCMGPQPCTTSFISVTKCLASGLAIGQILDS